VFDIMNIGHIYLFIHAKEMFPNQNAISFFAVQAENYVLSRLEGISSSPLQEYSESKYSFSIKISHRYIVN